MGLDAIFDFSASPVGGGIRRLVEYLRYFERSSARVLFLVHPAVRQFVSGQSSVPVEYVPRPAALRLVDDASIVRRYRHGTRCFFSYGIPIYQRMSNLDWFHLSNALPLVYRECTISRGAWLKNWLLERRFRSCAGRFDVLSAESQFSLDAYAARLGPPPQGIILRNGVEGPSAGGTVVGQKDGRALTVGVQGYKRLRVAYEVYASIREQAGLSSFTIVGARQGVPPALRELRDVTITGWVTDEELQRLYAAARVYISASEVENSSNAVLEAFLAGATCVLSRIPSHLEMVSRELHSPFTGLRRDFFVADAGCLRPEQCQSWTQAIDTMCDRMDLPRAQV
jgi:glycosyltransferase involved in cell wall biosynthesis